MKSFGRVQGTYSAVLRNIHGDDTSFEASYAVLALQMFPHAVGFFKSAPLAAGGKLIKIRTAIEKVAYLVYNIMVLGVIC
jgi:hypothetical protein